MDLHLGGGGSRHAGYVCARPSRCQLQIPVADGAGHTFFEHPVLQGQLGHDLLQRVGFATQVLDLVRSGCPGRIARQPLLARLEEVLRPAVIQVLDDPLAPAQLGDALLAAQALQNDADLVFGTEVPSRRTTDVPYDLLCRRFCRAGFLSHLRSF